MSFFSKSNELGVVEALPTAAPGATGKTVRHSNFPKSLKWHMNTDDTLARITITPARAEEMLAYNDRNRPLSATKVKHYAAAMKDGKWHYTREPITFSPERLIQGQHRLNAVLQSGASIEADIAFGAPDDSFYFIDVGSKRTGSDIFAINGVLNYHMAAAATRFLMAYNAGKTSGDGARGDSKTFNPSLQEVYEAYCTYERLQDSLHYGRAFASDRLPCPSIAGAVHYLCAQKSRKAADEFFEKIQSGLGFSSRRDPAYKVREFLTRADGVRFTAAATAAALIEGWNAMRTKKPLGKSIKADKIGRVI